MIYVVSDIHGRADRFDSILKQIRMNPEDHLYILGDVIDRGKDGIDIIRRIMNAENMTMLLGNHEYMMLNYLENPRNGYKRDLWRYTNGGQVTYEKWKECVPKEKKQMIAFLKSLPINIELTYAGKDWLLVHGSPECQYQRKRFRYASSAEYAVWNRIKEWDSMPECKTVVFGHTPVFYYQYDVPPRLYRREDRIGIDCGCAYDDGRLACLRLDDGAEFYSEDGE